MYEKEIILRQETLSDSDAIEILHNKRLGAGRYVKASYRVREQADYDINHSWVIVDGETVIASARQTWVRLPSNHECLFLGPLVVAHDFANNGYGIRLLNKCIQRAKLTQACAVILVGDAPYYERVGFKIAHCLGHSISLPGPVDPMRILIYPLSLKQEEKLKGQLQGITATSASS